MLSFAEPSRALEVKLDATVSLVHMGPVVYPLVTHCIYSFLCSPPCSLSTQPLSHISFFGGRRRRRRSEDVT